MSTHGWKVADLVQFFFFITTLRLRVVGTIEAMLVLNLALVVLLKTASDFFFFLPNLEAFLFISPTDLDLVLLVLKVLLVLATLIVQEVIQILLVVVCLPHLVQIVVFIVFNIPRLLSLFNYFHI